MLNKLLIKKLLSGFLLFLTVFIIILAEFPSILRPEDPKISSIALRNDEKRCMDAEKLTDEIVAKSINLSLKKLSELKIARSLTNDDICNMPLRKLERALFRLSNPKPDHPGEWAAFRALQQKSEDGIVKPDGLILANEQRKEMVASQIVPKGAGINSSSWTSLGPGNIGGRIRAILIHPTSPNTMWVGSVSGGIWQTTNGGTSWSPVNDFLGNLSISSLVIDPNNSNILYAGTGEGFFNSDSVRGAGIFKSTDGGATWSHIKSTNPASGSQWYYVNRLAIHPTNSQIILAGTNSGLYRSADSGNTWAKVYSRRTLDVDFDPNDGNNAVIGASFSYVARSTDVGVTWTESQLVTSGRVETAYAPSNSSRIYASVYVDSGRIYRSDNGGAVWSLISTPKHLGSQGWYDNVVWVSPTDENLVVIGGIDLYRSTDGGDTWEKISTWWLAPNSAHADHHAIVAHPNYNGTSNRTVFFGNDGGIYRANDINAVNSGSTNNGWQELNNNLSITQFYGGAGHGSAGERIVGGTQDNGSLVYNGNSEGWTNSFGGDGGFSAMDSTDDNIFYGEYVRLSIHRSTNGTSSSYICNGIGDGLSSACSGTGSANFIAPFILDPNNNNRLLAGGASLWQSNNAKSTPPTWSSIKSSILSFISAIAVAEGNSNVVWIGHNDGSVYRSLNGTDTTPTWTKVDTNGIGLPNRMVTRILVDKDDTNRVYVTFGGFDSDNLYVTTNNGTTWTDISGNIPSAPIRTIVRHPINPDWLYVGTEVGIFISENRGSSWSVVNDGPANVSVDELFWFDDNTLIAVTHGRGMFESTVGGKIKTFTIFNDGLGTLEITNIDKENGALWFSFSPSAPFSISPGQNQVVTVTIDTNLANPGTNTDRLIVSSNDPDENPYPNGVHIMAIVPTPTDTPTPTNTPTPTPTNTPTNTPTPSPTNTFTPTPTNTFTPTPTNTFTPSPTNTFTPSPTNTFTPTPTSTPTVLSLNAPSNLTAVGGQTNVTLSWDPSSQFFVAGYNVYRSTSSGTGFAQINSSLVTNTQVVDEGNRKRALSPGTYFYRVTAVTSDGLESSPSNEASAVVGATTLFIPDTNGPQGGTVEVPVGTTNADGINGMDMTIRYDATILSVTAARTTNLTAGWSLTPNFNNLTGSASLVLLGPVNQPLKAKSGALVYLKFTVSSAASIGSSSTLTFETLTLSDASAQAINASGQGGTLTVQAEFFPGDPNGDGAVNVLDAVKLLRLTLGLDTATPQESAASDLSGDGKVNFKDLILILRRIVGLERTEIIGPVGVGPKTVSIGDHTGLGGTEFTADVDVDNGSGIAGGSITVSYDPSTVSVQSVEKGDLTTAFAIFGTNPSTLPDTSGQIQIDFANATGISGESGGSLAKVTFKILESAPGGVSTLALPSVILSDETTNDIDVTTSNGSISTPGSIPAMSVTGLFMATLILSLLLILLVRKERTR